VVEEKDLAEQEMGFEYPFSGIGFSLSSSLPGQVFLFSFFPRIFFLSVSVHRCQAAIYGVFFSLVLGDGLTCPMVSLLPSSSSLSYTYDFSALIFRVHGSETGI